MTTGGCVFHISVYVCLFIYFCEKFIHAIFVLFSTLPQCVFLANVKLSANIHSDPVLHYEDWSGAQVTKGKMENKSQLGRNARLKMSFSSLSGIIFHSVRTSNTQGPVCET